MNIFISTNQKKFIRNSIKKGIRIDGRNLFDIRITKINFGEHDPGCVTVKLGETCVHCNISTKIIKPYYDKPFEGIIKFKTFFSGVIKSGKDSYYNQRLEKINEFIERTFNQTKVLDMEAFNVLIGGKALSLTCSIFITDDFGNVLDCAFLAILIALHSYKRSNMTVLSPNNIVNTLTEKISTSIVFQSVPMSITVGLLQNKKDLTQPFIIFDPSLEEENFIDGTMTYAIDIHGNILAIEKNGGLPLSSEQVTYCMQLCHSKVCQIIEQLKKILKNLEETDEQIRDKIYSKTYNPIDAFEPLNFKNNIETNSSDIEGLKLLPLTINYKKKKSIP